MRNEGFGFEGRPQPPEMKARLTAREAEKKRLAEKKRERILQWKRERSPSATPYRQAYV